MKTGPLIVCMALLACTTVCPLSTKAENMPPLKDKILSLFSSRSNVTQISETAAGHNKFGCALLTAVGQDSANRLLSPYSAFMALTLTAEGAKGTTADEMLRALATPGTKPLSNDDLQSLKLGDLGDGNVLKSANAVWVDTGFALTPAFLQSAHNRYNAEARELSLSAPGAVNQINGWVEKQTEGKIRDLLQDTTGAKLVITNALYMYAKWANPFDGNSTYNDEFTLPSGQKTDIRMMRQTEDLYYADANDYQVLELPYQGYSLAAIVVLPHKNKNLTQVEQALSTTGFKDAIEAVTGEKKTAAKVTVNLPKFRIENSIDMIPLLKSMGMHLPFKETADFTGIAPKNKDGYGLFISQVIQKTFIEVQEKGTEAAAATAVVMPAGAARPKKTEPPVLFIADHPFLFLVVDKKSGAVLFTGRVNDPTKM